MSRHMWLCGGKRPDVPRVPALLCPSLVVSRGREGDHEAAQPGRCPGRLHHTAMLLLHHESALPPQHSVDQDSFLWPPVPIAGKMSQSSGPGLEKLNEKTFLTLPETAGAVTLYTAFGGWRTAHDLVTWAGNELYYMSPSGDRITNDIIQSSEWRPSCDQRGFNFDLWHLVI